MSWLLAAPPTCWHVRAAPPSGDYGPGPGSVAPVRRRPARQPQPRAQPSIADRRQHSQVALEGPASPWTGVDEPSDAAVLAAVRSSSTHQQLAALVQTLVSRPATTPAAARTTAAAQQGARGHEHTSRTQPHLSPTGLLPQHAHAGSAPYTMPLQSQHAILVLSRLAQLYPSHAVQASVMMQQGQAPLSLGRPPPSPQLPPPSAQLPQGSPTPAPAAATRTPAPPGAPTTPPPDTPAATAPTAAATTPPGNTSTLSSQPEPPVSNLNLPTSSSGNPSTNPGQTPLTNPKPTPRPTIQQPPDTANQLPNQPTDSFHEWGVGELDPGQTTTQSPGRPKAGPRSAHQAGPRLAQGVEGGGAGEDEEGEEAQSMREETRTRQSVGRLADELVGIVMRGGLDRLQAVDMSELLSALARLGYPRTMVVAEVAEYLLLSGGMAQLHTSPHALANTAWSVAKLGHDPGPQWIAYFLQVSRVALPSFSAVDCAASCWALARWGFQPAEPWMAPLYARLRQVASQLGPQGVVNVGWALAMLKITVPRDVAELLMIEAQVLLPSMTAAGLATLCWALASLQHRPPGFWVEEALSCLVNKLPAVPPSARGLPFANVVWALSVWQTAQPTTDWLNTFCRQAARSLPVMSSRSIAVLLLGLADLGHTPHPTWVSLALEEFHKRGVSSASGPSVAAVLWAVSRLMRPQEAQGGAGARAWRPPRKWLVRYAHILQDLADSAAMRFPSLSPPDLVDVLVALADLRYHPGHAWLDTHTAYCNTCISEFSAYQMKLMSNALSGMAELREADYLPKKGEMV